MISELFDVAGFMCNSLALVVAPLKCSITTLFFFLDNFHPLTSLSNKSIKIAVTRINYSLSLLFPATFSSLLLLCGVLGNNLECVVLHCHFGCPH